MRQHFTDTGHKFTARVVCECGKRFSGGTSSGYRFHRHVRLHRNYILYGDRFLSIHVFSIPIPNNLLTNHTEYHCFVLLCPCVFFCCRSTWMSLKYIFPSINLIQIQTKQQKKQIFPPLAVIENFVLFFLKNNFILTTPSLLFAAEMSSIDIPHHRIFVFF